VADDLTEAGVVAGTPMTTSFTSSLGEISPLSRVSCGGRPL